MAPPNTKSLPTTMICPLISPTCSDDTAAAGGGSKGKSSVIVRLRAPPTLTMRLHCPFPGPVTTCTAFPIAPCPDIPSLSSSVIIEQFAWS